MTPVLPLPSTSSPNGDAVRTLRPEDVPALRLDVPAAAQLVKGLAAYPGRSVWAPATLEYALLAPWRHRPDIAHVQELAGVRQAEALLRGAVERSRALDDAMVLVIEMNDARHPARYRRAGLDPIEEVITYELDRARPTRPDAAPLRFRRARADAEDAALLLAIDQAAFPWLWWNSEGEFAAYARTAGVELWLGLLDGDPVCYLGITTFAGWGHLDRIAVAPSFQGRGLGARGLAFAIDTLVQRGARRVGLSTQRDNVRSQRLYERFGFRRSPGYDYRLYGAALRPPADVAAGAREAAGHAARLEA